MALIVSPAIDRIKNSSNWRFGLEAVRSFTHDVLPVIHVIWIQYELHTQALNALFMVGRHNLS